MTKTLHGYSPPLAVLRALLAAILMLVLGPAPLHAAPLPLSGYARPLIEQFLSAQTAGLPGKVTITIYTPVSGNLPPCDALEPFLPSGARLWGRVSVGVRCNASQPWTRYVQAYIAVVGSYHVAARQIEAGQALQSLDTVVREADLASLPASIIVDKSQLDGMKALQRITAGAPIRREMLRSVPVIQQGQNVKVIARGAGFVVSTEGKAMTGAASGAVIQVKIQGGQLISGVVQPDASVERLN